MAILKKNELKEMSMLHLQEKKTELQKEMIKINAQLSTKTTPENPGRIKATKKTIAKINTFMTQKKVQEQEKQQKKVDQKEPVQKKKKEVKKTKKS